MTGRASGGLRVLGLAASWQEERARPRGGCDPSLSNMRARPPAARGRCLLTPFSGGVSASRSFSVRFLRRQAVAR